MGEDLDDTARSTRRRRAVLSRYGDIHRDVDGGSEWRGFACRCISLGDVVEELDTVVLVLEFGESCWV